ncbi:muropeptide transporter [Methyloligella halotolerans]|uniref:Muropeptide transporter n=1 Tax=Methyloligella halotolerans TaxID=1177755 RepID=A0A1E2RVY4_9HYPH|nr:AmpG family muropeptide MFS transporter [Methyloligella halotolerans]ODA66416.1 muropeptide transporter [Methyloligella halotolerans]
MTDGTREDTEPTAARSWMEILLTRKMLACVFLGFTSGLPLYVLVSLVPAWLRSEEVDLGTIGLFALVQLPYTWKFVWSPLMDRYKLPFLGRRRGWALLMQVVLLIAIGALGHFDPTTSLQTIVALVFVVALFSASQDIVIDAYRRELLADDELGTGTSIFVNAYRISGLVPGSLALILAEFQPWPLVFWITGGFMLIGIVTTLCIREMSDDALAPHSLREAVVEPFIEFFSRDGGVNAGFAILAFLFLYKLGDNMATALATPFYLDMGYSLAEIGTVAKVAGLWASIAGGVLGGIIMLKVSINRALWLFGFVQLGTILPFVWLSQAGHSLTGLFVVVSGEYLGVGLGAIALTAFMARETSRAFTATQFALFTSLLAVPRTFANASTGFIVNAVGWTQFFLICAMVAIPGMLLLFKVAPWSEKPAPAGPKLQSSGDDGGGAAAGNVTEIEQPAAPVTKNV